MNDSLITIRSYKGESDLQPLVDLFDDCERIDRLESSISIDLLRLDLAAPSLDRDRDLRIWENATGQIIGFCVFWAMEPTTESLADGWISFTVHPSARGGEIERQIFVWAELRITELARERNGKPKLITSSRSSQIDRIAAIEHGGFVEDRQFLRLARPLSDRIIVPPVPEEFTIRCIDPDRDARSWIDLHDRCFSDHWNFHPMTLADYQHRIKDPNYLTEIDLVLVDRSGEFVALCYCYIDRENNNFIGRQEGWISSLATSPEFRRQGFARTLLLHALDRLKAQAMDIAKIGVDAENQSGAGELYASVGFEHHHTQIAYVKHL